MRSSWRAAALPDKDIRSSSRTSMTRLVQSARATGRLKTVLVVRVGAAGAVTVTVGVATTVAVATTVVVAVTVCRSISVTVTVCVGTGVLAQLDDGRAGRARPQGEGA